MVYLPCSNQNGRQSSFRRSSEEENSDAEMQDGGRALARADGIEAIEDGEREGQEFGQSLLNFEDDVHNESLVNRRAEIWLRRTYEEAINRGKKKEEKRVSKASVWKGFTAYHEITPFQ